MELNPETIKRLQAEVEKSEAELKVKKALLQQVKQKPKKPFVETSFGRAYVKFVSTTTYPFAKAHFLATQAYKDPVQYQCVKTMEEAEDIIAYCAKLHEKGSKKALKWALKAAETRVRLEPFTELPNHQEKVNSLRKQLHDQVERLRPERSKEKVEQVNEIVEDFVRQASEVKEEVFGNGKQGIQFDGGSEPEPARG